MQLIDFRKSTCEVYIGTYTGVDCDYPTTEANWTIIKYVNNAWVISAYIAKNVVWDDRVTVTYTPHFFSDTDIPASLLSKLLECNEVKLDSEVTCVSENDNLYILKFSQIDNTYRIYTFAWLDVTWTVTPIKCGWAEDYDIVSGGDYCDGWIDLTRFDIVDLTTNIISSSYFVNNLWVIVTPVAPVKWQCSESIVNIPGGIDIVLAWGTLWDVLPASVKSFSLRSIEWTTVIISWVSKILYPWQVYTWGQWDDNSISTTVVALPNDWSNLEVIYEI